MTMRSRCFFLCASLLAIGGAHAQTPLAAPVPAKNAPVLVAPLPPAPPVIPAVPLLPSPSAVPPSAPDTARQLTPREVRAIEAINKNTQIAARIEVWFSGSQSERFVFEEGDSAVVQEKGVGLRTVGTGSIEMGARKTSVTVQREDAKPEVFHTRFVTSAGGKLDAVLTLQIGEEKTLALVGGKPTKVTVKRLR